MGESIYKLTGIVVVLLFLFIMLFSKLDKNKIYVSYILICFPLVSLKLVNMLDCFEIISLLFILFFYKNKLSVFADSKLYSILVYLLVLSITFGFILCDLGPGKDTIDDFIGIFPIFIFTKVFLEECIHDSHFYFKIIKFIKISLFISFVFLFFQMILGVKFSLNENIRPNVIINGAIRYTSYFTDPQHFAQYLAIAGFVCFIPSENISKIKFNNYILIIFSVLAIMTTGTRSGLFGFILGIILILLYSKPSFIFIVIIDI